MHTYWIFQFDFLHNAASNEKILFYIFDLFFHVKSLLSFSVALSLLEHLVYLILSLLNCVSNKTSTRVSRDRYRRNDPSKTSVKIREFFSIQLPSWKKERVWQTREICLLDKWVKAWNPCVSDRAGYRLISKGTDFSDSCRSFFPTVPHSPFPLLISHREPITRHRRRRKYRSRQDVEFPARSCCALATGLVRCHD